MSKRIDDLAKRSVQPSSAGSGSAPLEGFVTEARRCLDPEIYEVSENPRDLSECFAKQSEGGGLGLCPEASITNRITGRKFFIEIKYSGPKGNADERAYKVHTTQFYKRMREMFGYDYHPYVTVFGWRLAVERRYTEKFKHLIEPDNYFLWVDSDPGLLCEYLRGRCAAWLD